MRGEEIPSHTRANPITKATNYLDDTNITQYIIIFFLFYLVGIKISNIGGIKGPKSERKKVDDDDDESKAQNSKGLLTLNQLQWYCGSKRLDLTLF